VTGWREANLGRGTIDLSTSCRLPLTDKGEHPETEAEIGKPKPPRNYDSPYGMAVVKDIGDLQDIHPSEQQDVAIRFALLALAKTYGRKIWALRGPAFKAWLGRRQPSSCVLINW